MKSSGPTPTVDLRTARQVVPPSEVAMTPPPPLAHPCCRSANVIERGGPCASNVAETAVVVVVDVVDADEGGEATGCDSALEREPAHPPSMATARTAATLARRRGRQRTDTPSSLWRRIHAAAHHAGRRPAVGALTGLSHLPSNRACSLRALAAKPAYTSSDDHSTDDDSASKRAACSKLA